MDCFLAFHGVGEIVVWHAAVTGANSAETVETRRNANGPADVCSETKDGASEGEERTFSARRTSAGEFIVVRVDCASGIRDSRPGKYPVMLLMVSPHIKLCGTVVLTTIR